MKRRFTILTAAIALLVFMMPSMAGWGQTRDTKTEGFENATAGSNYQGTVTIVTNESDCGIGWEIYYGNVSTSNKITGNNSAALRLYTNNNYGYLKTTTPIDGLSQVSFKAKAQESNSGKIRVNISYSTDGTTWTNIETDKELTTSAATYTEAIPSGGKYFQIAISSNSTKPTQKNIQLTIDDVVFTYGSTPTVMTPTISPEGRYFIDSKEVSITCSTEGASIYYTTDGIDPTISSTLYTESFTVTETTTVKAIAVKANYENSEISTAVFTKVTPMSVAAAIAATPSTGSTEDVCIHGIVSAFYNDNATILDDYSRRYYISDDGTTSNQLLVYNGKGLNNEPFTNADDLLIGDEVNIVGKLKMYQDAPEVDGGNYIISLTRPEPEQFDLTVGNLSHVNIYVFNAEDQTIPLLQGEGTIHIYNGTSMMLSVDVQDGCELQSLMVDGMDVTSQIEADAYTFIMPRHNVSVTATAEVLPIYSVVLCDDNTTLTEASYGAGVTLPTRNGDETYTFAGWSTTNVETETTTAPTIIPAGTYHPAQNITVYPVYTRTEGGGSTTEWHLTELNAVDAGVYALLTPDHHAFNGEINDNGRGELTTTTFSFDNNVAVSAPADICEITFTAVNGGFTMSNSDKGYLYAKGKNAGNLDWGESDENYWSYNASNWQYSENFSKAKTSLRSMSNSYFNTYASNVSGSAALILAKKVEVTIGTTYYTSLLSSYSKTLFGYGVNYNPETDPNEHWYLIASPMVGGSNPMSVQRLINTAGYDLYAFDQTEELEWRNYKVNTFTLESGKGYLYANSEDGDITFVGTPYSGNGQVELIYSTANSDPRMHGMNLVGNPFPEDAAYIDRDFYTVNPNSNEFMVVSRTIEPMEGAIVKTSGTQNETMTFSTTLPANNSKKLALNLSQGHGILDRAIVHFEESQPLTKLQMRDNSTSICIPMDGVDYASISADNQGEMPVSFKAEENGTYTLSFNSENVSFGYLHLVDNMTGNDVDLLANPSYTFEAKKTDYRSRFKLVFATGNNSNDDTFAFYSSGNWVINNEGEATLQVVDVTGRIVSSEAINGCANININAANGVYMLRLVNGNNVKTQKIVVK